MTTLELVRFNALRNAMYHTGRRMAYERWNRFFNFLVVILGTAATGGIITWIGVDPIWPAGAVAAVGAAQLVFDFGRSARDHQALQKEYYNLLADVEAVIEPTDDQLATWNSRMVRIAGDEPPTLRALDAKAYNDACDALEFDRDERLKVPWLHWALGSWIAFDGHTYLKLNELPGYKRPAEITAN
ncbi:hypothetical protein [Mesorhizobium sp.]|uniref:hypothetical protein n=1 Tax=Mesorhizobium sp. TaxID=1871066 RepID=UPI000FE724A9|nr:hypothetical protein [Mesorhizobium sp.]RWC58889.1 MAG: hypothetical protein EOS56_18440 [Mesorhizobium sp.]RWC66502.1 MAG: hypothetical protein EOS29_03795 [Mesorhizobium sp.]